MRLICDRLDRDSDEQHQHHLHLIQKLPNDNGQKVNGSMGKQHKTKQKDKEHEAYKYALNYKRHRYINENNLMPSSINSLMFYVLRVENYYNQGGIVNLKRRPVLVFYPII